ncbi:LmbU family transcriptional regulator [Actinomadura darangshiensis]|uniref:LmbU family transcriptional regulator n=1 Tax=Actinomadura darangshiensis TaxID=705336 RepID=UPI001FB80DC4|nr:LmbU family transcriptional regulator [Actinomadura darangshiensis]
MVRAAPNNVPSGGRTHPGGGAPMPRRAPSGTPRSTQRWSVQAGLGADAGVQARRAELHIPSGLTFESWLHIGRNLKMINDSSAWWLGDWLVYGEKRFPDRYRLVLEETALDYQTLRNYAWVARRFPAWRRRDALSLQHHAETAALPNIEQDRWLERAEKEKWSTRRLRAELRRARERAGEIPGKPSTKVVVNLDAGRRDLWTQAAEAARMPLLEWIAKVVDDAAADPKSDSAEASPAIHTTTVQELQVTESD